MNELLLGRLIRSLNLRRIVNITKTSASFFISAITEKPIVWGMPPVLTIEPTNVCNLHCPLCTTGAGEMLRPKGRMNIDTYRSLIDRYGDDIFLLLIYHQGEPYLNPNLFEFIKIAKGKNIYVTTSTNGHFFNQKNIDATIESGLDSMIVSLDGATQESYKKYRIAGNIDTVVKGTKQLLSERKRRKSRTPNVALQLLVMKHNEHEIPQIRELAQEIGVDRFLVKNIEVRSIIEAEKWLPEEEAYRRYFFNGDKLIVKGAEKKYCTRPWLSSLVNWDGYVVPCCFDKNGKYTMGNVQEINDFVEIWQNQPFMNFRKKLLEQRKNIDICRNCNQGFGSFLPGKLIRRNEK